jgi:2-polyprenyl-6-methoxyphenol hydroxylase-like FAD-dependent oxidoreductase
MIKEFVDVLVIGAGPSGCVSASYLHKNNVKIKVVEKQSFQDWSLAKALYQE